jgi:hypothetical protein
MKVITVVTLMDRDKEDRAIVTPPGEVELDNETARELMARGQAVTPASVREQAAAQAGEVHIHRGTSAPSHTP